MVDHKTVHVHASSESFQAAHLGLNETAFKGPAQITKNEHQELPKKLLEDRLAQL